MSHDNEIRAAARMHGTFRSVADQLAEDIHLEEPGLAAYLALASLGADMTDVDPAVLERGARLLDDGALQAAFDATTIMLNQLVMQRETLIAEKGRRLGAKETH